MRRILFIANYLDDQQGSLPIFASLFLSTEQLTIRRLMITFTLIRFQHDLSTGTRLFSNLTMVYEKDPAFSINNGSLMGEKY